MSKRCNKIACAILSAIMLAGCATAVQSKKEEPTPEELQRAAEAAQLQQEYEVALTLMRQGDYPSAIKEMSAFVERHPGLAGPYANLGILYHKLNRLEEAEQALSKAVALNPNNAVAQNRLGMVYRELGRFSDALNAYNLAIVADQTYPEPYLNLGILHDLYLLDGKKALDYYSRYQKMTGNKDSQVSMWITELQQRNQKSSAAGEKR